METVPKPTELLTAQVALYAERQVDYETPGRRNAILAHMGEVALYADQAPSELTYPLGNRIRRVVDGEVQTVAHAGDEMTMFDSKEYAELLKDPANRETSRNLAELIRAYDEVGPVISELGIVGLDLAAAREHPSFLAHGGSSMAFRFNGSVGGEPKELVALFSQNPEDPYIRAKVNSRAIALARAKGLPGLEQGVAVSYDPPVVVAELAKGRDMASLTLEERQSIPQEHWDQLQANMLNAVEHGLDLDPNSDNFVYDPENGFTIIDLRLPAMSEQRPLEEVKETQAARLSMFRDKMLAQDEIRRN